MAWSVENSLSERPPALPDKQRRIGSSIVEWFESEPGVAVILSEGGTVDDRFLAYVITRDELAACGIRNAKFTFDGAQEGEFTQVREVDAGPAPNSYGVKDLANRRPYYYHIPTNTVYLGPPGAYHMQIQHHVPSLRPDSAQGYVMLDSGEVGNFDGHLGFDEGEVNRAVAHHLGPEYWAIEDNSPSDLWHEASGGESGYDRVTWTPGQYGKGILTGDGVLHMWGVGDDNDGDPIHNTYAFENGIRDPHTRFWIHPQGDIHGYTIPAYAVGTHHSWEELMHYVHQHNPQAQYKGVGYPYDSVIENASPSLWEDEPSNSSARFLGSTQKTADWNDIMAKAKRLVQSGNVTLLRNGYNIVVAHVIGDHGEYTCEISRDDPQSRAITQWTCECPWDQFAFQRTRKWKKYEGRPCAHVLAAYWQSLSTPLDEDSPPGQEQRGPGVPPAPGGVPVPGAGPLMAPNQMGTPDPFQPRIPVPGQPGPDGGQMPSLPPATQDQFSTPPPSPGPYPPEANPPMQMFQPPADNSIIPPYPMDPNQYQLPVSVPGGRPGPYPANPMQQPGTFSKIAGANDEFPPGSAARMEEATYGQTEGREGAIDAGQWVEIPKNARVEVVYQDPTTGWVEILYPLKGGAMTSYHARCFVEPDKLTPFPGVDSPMAPRRRR